MGLTHKICLEPFIKIPIQYETYEREIKTCGNHENNSGDNFCPTCGKIIITKKIPSKSIQWCDELIGNENFYHYIENDDMYLLSNTRSKIEIDTSENVFTTITSELINSMIEEFSEKHKENIKLLEAKINSKVKVEFGFVYNVR